MSHRLKKLARPGCLPRTSGRPARRRAFRGCIAIALLAVPLVRLALAADPATEEWQAHRQMVQTLARRNRLVDVHRLVDVLQIRLENRSLTLRTPLFGTGDAEVDAVRATLDGLPGIATIHVQRRREHPTGLAEPAHFNLQVVDFPRPRQETVTAVTMYALREHDELTLSKLIQFPNGASVHVMLTQHRGPQSDRAGTLQLTVAEVRGVGIATEQLNLAAPDFADFVRDHPEQTNRYIRPLLRDLGQEVLFAPEPMVAWQVFSDTWKADPAITRKVQELVPRLEAKDYRARDAATAELQRLGRDAAAVLLHMDRSRLSAEQNARIDRALLPYAQLPVKDSMRLRSDPGFLLDCLYSDELMIRSSALERLRMLIRPDIQFDVNADALSRSAAVDVLRHQLALVAARPAR